MENPVNQRFLILLYSLIFMVLYRLWVRKQAVNQMINSLFFIFHIAIQEQKKGSPDKSGGRIL